MYSNGIIFKLLSMAVNPAKLNMILLRCSPVYFLMQEESFLSCDCCILYRLNAAIGEGHTHNSLWAEKKKNSQKCMLRIGGPLLLICFRSNVIIVIN